MLVRADSLGRGLCVKIVYYFDRVRLEQGGTLRSILDLSRVMASRGHDVTLVTFDDTDIPAAWRDGTPAPHGAWPRVVKIDAPTLPAGFYPPGGPAQIAGLLHGADLVHLSCIWQPSTAQVATIARRLGIPTVLSCHGMLDEWSMRQSRLKKQVFLGLVAGGLLKHSTILHATADDEKRQAAAWVPEARIAVVPYVTDLSLFERLPGPQMAREKFGIPALGTADDLPVVLFLSRLHYKKQPETLIRAAKALDDRGVRCRVLFAGTGDEAYVQSLHRLITDLKLDPARCRLVGMVSGDLKLSLYQAADVFALPTSQENFGLVYTEALACETPIIATRGTDIWRELERSGAAEIADATPAAFADAIARMVSDRPALAERGRRGRAFVFDWLEVDRTAAAFEAMYQRACAEKPHHAGASR